MSTRAQQVELLAVGVLYDGAVIATPYAKFLAAGTTTAKNAWDDAEKAVAITKKALDAQGRAVVYGDGTYKIQIYSGDPDAGGVLKFTVDQYKVTAVQGNARTITQDTTGSEDDGLVLANTASQNIIYTLPSAALMAGKSIQIVKTSGSNTLTVSAGFGQTVNGAASIVFVTAYSSGVFNSDGSNWYVSTESTGVKAAVVQIGDWDMDATPAALVALPANVAQTKVRGLTGVIRDDDGTYFYAIMAHGTAATAGNEIFFTNISSTNIVVNRRTGGTFDSINYNSTGYNRGWVTVFYED